MERSTGYETNPKSLFLIGSRLKTSLAVLYEHKISREKPGLVDFSSDDLPYPGVWLNDLSLLTFAAADDFADYLAPNFFVAQSREIPLQDFLERRDSLKEGPNYLAQISRLAWEHFMRKRLPAYESSDGRFCYYFKKGAVPDDTVSFVGANGKKGYRGVVGYKTMPAGKLRYWHYAISGKPLIRPETLFLIKGHVLLSDDGVNLWTNKDLMAKAEGINAEIGGMTNGAIVCTPRWRIWRSPVRRASFRWVQRRVSRSRGSLFRLKVRSPTLSLATLSKTTTYETTI